MYVVQKLSHFENNGDGSICYIHFILSNFQRSMMIKNITYTH